MAKQTFGLCIVGLLAWTTTASCHAQTAEQMYGRGVHAFYRGQYAQAESLTGAAINRGLRDPSCYYFRGLSRAKQSHSAQAVADFKRGAHLEFRSEGRHDVGSSLVRIQGTERLELERIRNHMRRLYRANGRQVQSARGNSTEGQIGSTPPTKSRSATGPIRRVAKISPVIPDNLSDDPNDPFTRDDATGLIGAVAIKSAKRADEFSSQTDGKPKQVAGSKPKQMDDDDPFGALEDEGPALATQSADGDTGRVRSLFDAVGRAFGSSQAEAAGDDSFDPFSDEDEMPDAFAEPAQDDLGADPFGAQEEPVTSDDDDPFGADEVDPFADLLLDETDDQSTEDDTESDPFDVDVDPFADDES